MTPIVIGAGVALLLYVLGVLALVVAGRREEARALAGFIPDCLVLMKRLLSDPRIPRRRKVILAVVAGYLAMPIDLVPDFIPVAGQLDDVIIVGWALRHVLGAGDRTLLDEHWPGPDRSKEIVARALSARS